MKSPVRQVAFLIFFVALSQSPLAAGVFLGTAACSLAGDCVPFSIPSAPNNTVPPFAITHPFGYNGSGGNLQIRICVAKGSEELLGPIDRAIRTWNALIARTGTCSGCRLWEDGFATIQSAHAESTLLHELGHCPLGLDHPDRNWDAQPDGTWEPTSFTRSWGVAAPPDGIRVGGDFIRGTSDDTQIAPNGQLPESVHWFRIEDNNPVIVDIDTVIDINTYSRSVASNLPPGHEWAANANRRTAERLGFPNTQAVMYGLQGEETISTDLVSDEVNMIKMGMTGQDLTANTSDDYTVELVLVEPCVDPVDVLIGFGAVPGGTLAFCNVSVDFSFPQNPFLARHFTVMPPEGQQFFFITLNEDIAWDTAEPEPVFSDGFETGDLSSWSAVVP